VFCHGIVRNTPFFSGQSPECCGANSGLLNHALRAIPALRKTTIFQHLFLSGINFRHLLLNVSQGSCLLHSLDLSGISKMRSSILAGKTWATRAADHIRCHASRCSRARLVASCNDDSVWLAGDPRLPAASHHDTKIWSLFQYPPKAKLAAAASLPLRLLTIILLRGRA